VAEADRDRPGLLWLEEMRFEDFAKKFLGHQRIHVKAWKRYESSIGNLAPFFGNVNLTAIDAQTIERFKLSRMAKVEPSTVNRDPLAAREGEPHAHREGLPRERRPDPVPHVRGVPAAYGGSSGSPEAAPHRGRQYRHAPGRVHRPDLGRH